ncbi:helix-turn-helix domain-containing protein [Shewanella sp. KX20019]|uniref:helix-turn-helix domain-containing protein n=1 Tax=Shewanella sp. KX20019 TaxID=2803864 RepID=UPI0019259B4B|nr:helix-turn-helix domain-containing protein [Shewanella sp. KX20019]QQX78537.1 helix-turn-helix domain-containing protein [Shewanella sp. KX20019]
MSMELMVKAMKAKVGNPLRKLVLIKLADNASDAGECWPSYQHIAEQCEIAKSTVRKHIKELEEAGLLTITNRKGPKGNSSNLYILTLCRQIAPPVPSDSTGMPADSTGGMPSDSTGISHSFEPVNEPLKDIAPRSKKSAVDKLDFSSWPAMPTVQVLADWIAMRKDKKAKLNQTAINRLAKHLHDAVAAGFSVEDCIATCATRGWVGFEAKWLINAGMGSSGGKSNPLLIPTHSQANSEQFNSYDQDFDTEL